MTHYANFGLNRSSMTPGIRNVPPSSSSSLPIYTGKNSPSTSKSTTFKSLGKTSESKTLDRTRRNVSRNVAYENHYSPNPLTYDIGLQDKSVPQTYKDHSITRLSEWKPDKTISKGISSRPHSIATSHDLLHESIKNMAHLPTTYTSTQPQSKTLLGYKKSLDRSSRTSYNSSLLDPFRYSSYNYTREKVKLLNKIQPQQKAVELTGWRAKLADEDFSPKASKDLLNRQWHYVDDADKMEEEDGFAYVICCSTQTGNYNQMNAHNISRDRKMKLKTIVNEGEDSISKCEIAIQVKTDDLGELPADIKPKRTFISSRHTSWYQGGSYNKYVSAVPWRTTSYTRPTSLILPSSIPTHKPKNEVGKKNEEEDQQYNKSFRKSVLNVNLPESEVDTFQKNQLERRKIKSGCRSSRTSSESTSSTDGSPNETGYDSAFTDCERRASDGYTEGNRSISSLSSEFAITPDFNTEYKSGDETRTKTANRKSSPQNARDANECISTIPLPKVLEIKESDFRFRSIKGEPSQRDSGFSEISNQCETSVENTYRPGKLMNSAGQCISSSKSIKDTHETDIGKSKFISNCHDIDFILLDQSFRTLSSTFEDFDRQLEVNSATVSNENRLSFDPLSHGSGKQPGDFIGKIRDIDDVLGSWEIQKYSDDIDGESTITNDDDAIDAGSTTATSVFEGEDIANVSWLDEFDEHCFGTNSSRRSSKLQLDDCTLQLYRYKNGSGEGDYGSYLDLESTVDEQPEEFEGFHNNRKNAVILRTQLSVRVHAIVEKLVNSSGRELRRALFSLKQIFQDDKDLVHEFVQNDGLACLIKVGSEADQNYQNYILRAMGQVMLYVDGMNGVIEHNDTIQWLYSLIASKYRLVVKTALKLLLVFVEYTESNSQLFINAMYIGDSDNHVLPMTNIMNLLKEKDSADMELLVYAATLINKMLNAIPDQDTYYDIVDTMEEQGMEHVIQYYMSKQGTDLDLLQQFQIYEAVLKFEDGVPDSKVLPLDARLRKVPRSRKSYPGEIDRRKSRRHSVGTLSSTTPNNKSHLNSLEKTPEESPFVWQDRTLNRNGQNSFSNNSLNAIYMNGNGEHEMIDDENGITPALRRRRERDARNKSLIKEQEQNGKSYNSHIIDNITPTENGTPDCHENSTLVIEDLPLQSVLERRRSCYEGSVSTENQKNSALSQIQHEKSPKRDSDNSQSPSDPHRPNCLRYARGDTNKKAWMFSMMYAKSQDEDGKPLDSLSPQKVLSPVDSVNNNHLSFKKSSDDECKLNLRHEGNIKNIQERFSHRHENGAISPTSENVPRLGDSSGIISRAKEGLAASTVRPESKISSPTDSPNSKWNLECKKLDSDLQWEQLMMSMKRPLIINDLDFTDLQEEEDHDFLPNGDSDSHHESSPPPLIPPPPPPMPLGGIAPPPPPPLAFLNHSTLKQPTTNNSVIPPPWVRRNQHQELSKSSLSPSQKTKKTVKLFWREVKEDHSLLKRIGKKKTIWDELKPVPVDTQKLEHLFENRVKEVMNKEKTQDSGKKTEIIVLDTKRSNAINIGMTKLPPPRTIKTAILKMDSAIMNREGIEKILTTMLPTADEKSKIAEAQMANPDVPLGTAEQFLLTLSSISELEARLRLWAFRLDYDSIEKEVAEPLMDLKQAMKEIENSETFRVILSTLRSIGNFLNGAEIKGFHIEYLSKVPEVKDTVQKHSLLHHLCHIVMEKFPKSSDLYSEIGSVTRASKVDYAEVSKNLNRMEGECKASWDYLKAIAKHDCSITLKVRTSEFLTDCAERIIVLKVVHRRMINRYRKFLVYLGCVSQSIEETPIQRVCKILSEFALEYRTTRERVLQQIEKKANHRERNKTRGKMITEMERFRTKEQQADHELRQLLGNGAINGDDQRIQKWGTVPSSRGRVKSTPGQGGSLGRHSAPAKEEGLTDGDDEILETLVKTATTQPTKNEPRIRKRARYGDRKSLRRTLKNGLSEEERNMLSTMITT